jgi:hypothetical protein
MDYKSKNGAHEGGEGEFDSRFWPAFLGSILHYVRFV